MTDVLERPHTALHSPELERQVLGALLAIESISDLHLAGAIVRTIGDQDAFYEPKHALIYGHIRKIVRDNELPFPVSVISRLDANGLNLTSNGTYLMDLYHQGRPEQGVYHATELRKWTAKRAGLNAYTRQLHRLTGAPISEISEVLRAGQEEVAGLRVSADSSTLVSHDKVNAEVVNWLSEQDGKDASESGALSGWSDLDRLTGGLRPGQVAVAAGRPGMGKSTMARNWVMNSALRQELPAAFFSLEMTRLEVGLCMLSAGTGVALNVLKSGNLADRDWSRVARFVGETEQVPLYYDETEDLTLDHMDAGLTEVASLHGRVEIAAFDYLQLASGGGHPNTPRERVVAELSRGTKLLGKKHKCGIILVSQLNRGPEGRPDKRPQLSDLRESGSIEQDADMVFLLHRDDYYDKESPRAGEADFILAKHRGGPTDTVTVAAQLHYSRFVDFGSA